MTKNQMELIKFKNETKFLLVDLLVHLEWEDRERVEKFLKEHYLEFSPHTAKILQFQRDLRAEREI